MPDTAVWLPMGEQPTFADDEALIAALRDALHWAGHQHGPGPDFGAGAGAGAGDDGGGDLGWLPEPPW
ncbi:hypothetical protein [Amycolatopsis sp. CA-128772]|uniref:hypothetical protein n=1 Tax=Amycolatopsis sp. CA-128772 TaxID=2073159 RepID=UPI0011AFEC0F|nr:hypothetical protein [Amycolatopsis sp. CA-128772]